MLTWIIIVLLVLWLLGYFGPSVFTSLPRSSNIVHVLLVVVIVLVILNVAGVM